MTSRETIRYYDTNASVYSADTIAVDFTALQARFLEKLKEGAYILDFGCGAGRDTKAFLERRFTVDALDGSEKLCEIAEKYTGIIIKHMYFQDLEEVNKYNGIWACASILHLDRQELVDVLRRMARALQEHGIIYTSFKYGTFEGERDGRYYTDMTEDDFAALIAPIASLTIEEQWITSDDREGHGDEQWLNVILRKQ